MNRDNRDSEAPRRALQLRRERARLDEQDAVWKRERLEVVAALIRDGWSHADVAELLGVAKQRVGQLLQEARAAGLVVDEPEPLLAV